MHTTAQLQGHHSPEWVPWSWAAWRWVAPSTPDSQSSVPATTPHLPRGNPNQWASTPPMVQHCTVSLSVTAVCHCDPQVSAHLCLGVTKFKAKENRNSWPTFLQTLRLRFHWRPLDNRIAHKGHTDPNRVSLSFPPVVRHQGLQRRKK